MLNQKRIGFVITQKEFDYEASGVQTFLRGWERIAKENDFLFDVILDQPSKNPNKLDRFNIIVCDNPLSYAKQNKLSVFSENINFERVVNFRDSIVKALSKNIYSGLIINTPDGMPAIAQTDITKYIPCYYYTHHIASTFLEGGNYSNMYSDFYISFMKKMMSLLPNATQSLGNKNRMPKNYDIHVLPMPFDSDIFYENMVYEKEGVLYIGRYENRKNASFYCEAVAKAGLKAKILTNKHSIERFEKKFKELGYDNYEIVAEVYGKEKVKFIQNCKVASQFSHIESFGFSAFEAIYYMPCLFLAGADWNKSFDLCQNFYETSKKDVVQKLKELHQMDYEIDFDVLRDVDRKIFKKWVSAFNHTTNQSDRKTRIHSLDKSYSVETYLRDFLNRKSVSLEDLYTIYSKLDCIDILHTRKQSFFNLKGQDVVKEEEDKLWF